jgi:hypothetical protein
MIIKLAKVYSQTNRKNNLGLGIELHWRHILKQEKFRKKLNAFKTETSSRIFWQFDCNYDDLVTVYCEYMAERAYNQAQIRYSKRVANYKA